MVGLDVDRELLDEAAVNLAGLPVELVCGDVRALPFADASFDVVIDFGTTYHIGRPLGALREIARVLAPGGRFCHETPLAQALSHPWRWAGRTLPWTEIPEMGGGRRTVLWSCRMRAARWMSRSGINQFAPRRAFDCGKHVMCKGVPAGPARISAGGRARRRRG